jgi:copper chaperone CopZ
MKTFKYLFAAIIAISVSATSFAQTHNHSKVDATTRQKNIAKKETIKVSGNCETCKSRIEKAAKLNGVTQAIWNDKTKVLTLAYDPEAVTSDEIQKSIAAVGHDTPKYKATSKVYNALPSCCKYR